MQLGPGCLGSLSWEYRWDIAFRDGRLVFGANGLRNACSGRGDRSSVVTDWVRNWDCGIGVSGCLAGWNDSGLDSGLVADSALLWADDDGGPDLLSLLGLCARSEFTFKC